MNLLFKNLIIFIFYLFFLTSNSFSESRKINDILINGNDRISYESIIMFSTLSINDQLDENQLNDVLKKLYETNFFNDVSLNFVNNILTITVIESPLIENIIYEGVDSEKLKETIIKNLELKTRSSYNEITLEKDKNSILNTLKNLGYHFSSIDVYVESLIDNKTNITYKINLGEKAKIKRISFIGNKIFKDSKLKSIIVSEEYKFWKFVSGKKFLNESLVNFDKKLLKNFYLNSGYYDVVINSSFARIVDNKKFELVFNIDAKNKFFFGDINLDIPNDYVPENFQSLVNLFGEIKGNPYSINTVEKILEKIDQIAIEEQYESITATVNENISSDIINLTFVIKETEKYIVERINVFGNNVTRENVIRNQLEIDEGDIFNDILQKKSENNLKSLNFFKKVKLTTVDGSQQGSKIINIDVEEKPTGEISAGAGFGTTGATISVGIKENNYLGKGVGLTSNLSVDQDSIRGILSVTNPNFRNSDKSVYTTIESTEVDRLTQSGYKATKIGASFGTNFEYLDDLNLGVGLTNYYENIDTNSSASALQKKQEGDYWDSFLNLNFKYDKRNQKFKTSKGYYNRYSTGIPLISENNTFTNTFETKYFSELYENNVSTASLLMRTSNSLTDDNIKISERLFIPSKRLRGFERGKVGPKDGNAYIGGNYLTSLNFTSTLPQFFENSENVNFLLFADAAKLWGVDYNSALEKNNSIKSSLGLGVDWFTAIGPLSFSYSLPITKDSSDITETFRFDLGTSF